MEVAKVFGALRGMMRPLRQSESVSLVFEDPPDDLLIVSDEGKISQILRNLISNALKFTEYGEVRVRVSCENERRLFFRFRTRESELRRRTTNVFFANLPKLKVQYSAKYEGRGLGSHYHVSWPH